MAELPDAGDRRPVPYAQRPIVGYDATQVSRALTGVGREVGASAQKQVDDQQQFELERARSHVLTSAIEAESGLDSDNDFGTYESRYKTSVEKAYAEGRNLITDPHMQEKFDLQMEPDMARGLAQVKDKARGKERDFGRGELFDRLNGNMNSLMKTTDPKIQQGLIQNSAGLLQAGIAKMYVSAEEAAKEKQKFAGQYAQNKIALMPPEEQEKVLSFDAKQPAGIPTVQPLGIRNNNPGNLRGDDSWQGRTGTDGKGFAQFANSADGLRAMAMNLRAQQDKHGLDTVEAIVSKYAPSSENDTGAYIRTVAREMGVVPDEKLDLSDPDKLSAMMRAMIKHENGTQPYSEDSIKWAATTAAKPDTAGAPPPGSVEGDVAQRTGTIADFLDPADRVRMLLQARKTLEEKGQVTAAITNYGNPDFLYDPGNPDHRKGVDKVFENAGGVAALQQMNPAGANTVLSVAQRTGIVPEKAQGALRSMMDTGNTKQKAFAFDVVAQLQQDTPRVLDQFKPDEISRAVMYAKYTRNGMDEATALDYVKTQFDPLNKQMMEMRKEKLKGGLFKELKTAVLGDSLSGDFADIFDPGIFTSGPDMPRNAAAADAALGAYRDAIETEYMMHGDEDVAKQRAAEQVKRVYGQSSVNGRRTVMMYPPEKFYGIAGVDDGWMGEQLLKDVRGLDDASKVDASKFETKLSPAEETKFQSWLDQQHASGAIHDGDYKNYKKYGYGYDYDFRAAYQAGLTADPKTGHWADLGKKPNHETFSDQSKYAKEQGARPGHWEGDNFIPAKPAGDAVSLDDLELLPDKVTAADVAALKFPRYQVLKQTNGVWDSLRDKDGNVLHYGFDPSKVVDGLSKEQKAEREATLWSAHATRQMDQQWGDKGGLPMMIGKEALKYAIKRTIKKREMQK